MNNETNSKMANLTDTIIKVKELKTSFKACESFEFKQFENYTPKPKPVTRTITKKKIEKFGLGDLIGLRVYTTISDDKNYHFGEVITGAIWVFENGERN
tara:strand:- start:207 stop:503 length:297 start_codon:yes stop_codon:yes gene_type:complete